MTATAETFQFQTEARQLLDLMIHSVYSHKEIFLRELVSNASDALDKLRFEALTNESLKPLTHDLHIRLEPNATERTLTIHDNGIGMNRDELIRYIGTIARSGTAETMRLLREAQQEGLSAELIGQFGVGFYSSFMVADRVTLVTRRAGEEQAWRWESAGDGTYTIEEAERAEPGTSVTLHLKNPDEEDGLEDFTREWVLRDTIRKYSDFVAYPIRMQVEREEIERDEEGKPKEGGERKKVVKDETLNSMKAIWLRPEKEVNADEYKEFYKHLSHDWSDPLAWFTLKAEGTQEFRALLYLPSRAPFDLFMRDGQHGISLYIKRVFIMNDCKELLPEYLRFARGVVDSEDLSLNISRELLQRNRQIQVIRKRVTKKLLDELGAMMRDEREKYLQFWKEFGRVLKEGLFQDHEQRETLLRLAIFHSTHEDSAWTTLEDYVGRMKDGQDTIYYMTGESLEALKRSPHLEAFRDKGIEVLLMTDPVDEVWTQSVFEFKEKKFASAGKGEVELGGEEERKAAEEKRKEQAEGLKSLFEALRAPLQDHIKEVRLSSRLTRSPACLVGDQHDLSPQLEQLLRASGQAIPTVKRILELNPEHPILEKLKAIHQQDANDPRLGQYAELLYGQALLAEGGKLPDPAAFSKRIEELMTQTLG
ncbi:MAG: Chaperone protein HtpG [candidate division BRC1 bacterium ADurb.BinA292]|mgnify:CR=1 FL=1|nr:MAG: Chaperone protein HtpG [candidate division BRC1 bacterium ADurb.BinA292]HOR28284.1 molecular chaperone HtpG [Candidatus Sumerlaeota bacterium]